MKQILPDVIGFNLYMMDCMQLILAETNYIDPVRVEIYEIVMTENFPKLMINSKPKIQEVQRMPSSINARKPIPRNTLSKT